MKLSDSQYTEFYKFFHDADLMGLIKIGAPDDEYSPEAKKVLQSITPNIKLKDLQECVYDVFVENFGQYTGKTAMPPRYYNLADQLYAFLRKEGLVTR